MRTTDNNGGKSLSDIGGKDSSDLSVIANKRLIDLQEDNPDLLIFPPKLGQYHDGIEKQHIFSLYDDVLTTYNLMGFVGRNDTQIAISSRFARNDQHDYFLHYMLGKVLSLNIVNLDTTKDHEGIEDFLPYLFPAYLKRALSQGIFKQYRRNEYNNANVNGVVDITRHIRLNIPFSGKIAYSTREYGYDNSMTELIRHTIEHLKTSLIGSAVLTANPNIRSDVQKIIDCTHLYNKNNRRKVISANRKAVRHPYFTEYFPLQRLCLQILKYESVSFGNEKDKVHGIIFDGAWLWEEYLNTILKDNFNHPHNITREGKEYLFCDNDGKMHQEIYPDFVGKAKHIIADAKYKHLEYSNEEYGRNDYFQILTYMYRFRSGHGFLLFPHTETAFYEQYSIINTEGKLTKLGLAIPQQADNYKLFCSEIIKNEEKFLCKIIVTELPAS
jgi:5-methylcytosine-specific restriction endonuclease McrBC regulatory subunit McrC